MDSSDQNSNCTFAHDYPNSNIITTTYHENNRKTHLRKHIIHSLGVYPSNVKKTKKSSKNYPEYEIPDNYKVETLEGYKIVCKTNYLLDGTVKFTLNWKDSQGINWYISNNNSASGIAKDFLKLLNKKTRVSGIMLFGFNIPCLIEAQKNNPIYINLGGDEVIGIDLSKVNSDFARVHQDAIVRACDEALILRDGYRHLAAINSNNFNNSSNNSTDNLTNDQKNYKSLSIAVFKFSNELDSLKSIGFTDQDNIMWNIEFYFSGDWKFMALIKELKAANSKYFYVEDPSLFPVIELNNWIPNELHIMLRITDILMDCLFKDLMMDLNDFKKITKGLIEKEMQRIGLIHFQFFESKSKGKFWDWTTLTGPERLIMLQYFDVTKFIASDRGKKISFLWKEFLNLYQFLRKDLFTDPDIDSFD
ncbi:hypothetical protein RhiirA1_456734 [Rhizophagus irregularis]|uniref:Uncharacterized protein n=1 Tax=Rhizophagus irregularis TaxID=588596 RepID=A0A2N0RZW6_9GLOM|nr:hypothetical protein RhiirA1_456734 [Rhizophagus irregularis]